jgi:stearoyl-CoA desaturase (delta-9 desaturase)
VRTERKATFARWFDSAAGTATVDADSGIDWLRVLPFVFMHLACISVLWVGSSSVAIAACVALYGLRMLAITAFYHRYFSHRAFRTSRAMQLVFALLGASAVQRGPLWWAGHHRYHHATADSEHDVHSPRHGFLWSHVGWFLTTQHFPTRLKRVTDLGHFPELRFLDRYDALVPIVLAAALYGLGTLLEHTAPSLGTNGPQLLVWGFFVSTVALYHATFTVNSLTHRFGSRRFATHDQSRNNWWVALITFGEGWHNNHHRYPGSARQGFRWWELDITYGVLRMLAALGLIWDLHPVPPHLRRQP